MTREADYSAGANLALTAPISIAPKPRLTVYKSRVWFDAGDLEDHAPAYAHAVADFSNPLSETCAYVSSISLVVTAVRNPDGNLSLLLEGSDTETEVTLAAAPIVVAEHTRIGLWDAGTDHVIILHDGSGWRLLTYDPALLIAETAECVTANDALTSTPGKGAAYPVSATETVIVAFNEGAIRPYFVDSDGDTHACPGRLFDPTAVIDPVADTDDYYLAHFAGAVKRGGVVYVYVTAFDGSVKVISYTLSSNLKDGMWSDFQTCWFGETTIFEIGNIFLSGTRIFMCGRFYRTPEYNSDVSQDFLTWSDDGFMFSQDRWTLVSWVKLRFLATTDGTDLVFSAMNRTSRHTAPYQIAGEDAESVEVALLAAPSGNPNGVLTCAAAAGLEQYFNHPIIIQGAYAKLEWGVKVGDDYEWYTWLEMVVSSDGFYITDGGRDSTIQLMGDGHWHTAKVTYPNTMEITGRDAIWDDTGDFSNLHPQKVTFGPAWTLSCDLHTPQNGGVFAVQTHADGDTDTWWGPELSTIYTTYPKFGSEPTYEFKILGWSRAGVPDQNPNVADVTPTDTNNDTFIATILCRDPGTATEFYVTALPADLDSTYSHPPQTYFDAGVRAGSDPVVYNIPSPGAGFEIMQIGVQVVAPNGEEANTTYYVALLAMPGINVSIIEAEEDSSFELETKKNAGLLTITGWITTSLAFGAPSTQPPQYQVGSLWNSIHYSLDGPYSFASCLIATQNQNDFAITVHMRVVSAEPTVVYHGPTLGGVSDGHTGPINAEGDVVLGPGDSVGVSLGSMSIEGGHLLQVYFDVTESAGGPVSPTLLTISNKTKGKPQVLFAERPFRAWNFEITSRFSVVGTSSYAGLIGLASDPNNYLLGYIKAGYAGIAVVRDSIREIIIEVADGDITESTFFDMRFWHCDGLLGVEYKLPAADWPARGSQVAHEWAADDGPIATSDFIYHVGAYSHIDPPKFRITGHDSSNDKIGVMPLDLDVDGISEFIDLFPSSGQADIAGVTYSYTGKAVLFAVDEYPLGPFQFFNIGTWPAPYNTDPDGEPEYIIKPAIEFSLFRWLDGETHADDYEDYIVASSAGFAWLNYRTLWKPWIQTAGEQVLERNRSRWISSAMPAYTASGKDKIWITNALTGVRLTHRKVKKTVMHPAGDFCYLHKNDKTYMTGFYATSGDHDYSVQGFTEMFCRISGTAGDYIGDYVNPAETLADGEGLALDV